MLTHRLKAFMLTMLVAILVLSCDERPTDVDSMPSEDSAMELLPPQVVIVPKLPEQVRILSINNSIIYYNSQDTVFNNIASAMGKDAIWVKHTLLGQSLSTHWNEGDGLTENGTPSAKMMVRSAAWSHIILQEQSALSRTDPETFLSNLRKWVEYIRENCPNPYAIIIVPVNWPYSNDWENYSNYSKTFAANYKRAAQELGVSICPVGDAYNDAVATEGISEAETWFVDMCHPTLKASYMAACMEYGLIFGEDPAHVTYLPDGMSANEARKMRSYASRALKAYENVVDQHAGKIRYSNRNDRFPEDTECTFIVSGGGNLDSENVLTIDGTQGDFIVTATYDHFRTTAHVKVAEAVTDDVPPYTAWIIDRNRPPTPLTSWEFQVDFLKELRESKNPLNRY